MGAKKIEDVSKKELISLDDAVILAREFFRSKVDIYTRKTLQKKICLKEINRYGPRHRTMVDKKEFIEKLCKPFA